jgi:predicted transglutaminase-like cysteine proteinase
MLGRVAACAAVLFAWPICTGAGGGGMMPYSGIAVAMAQEQAQQKAQQQSIATSDQTVDTEGQTRTPPRQDTHIAAPTAGAEPAPANHPVSSTPLAPTAEPFGLAAERVSEGEILHKWTTVQTEIRENKKVLARCREDTSSCPLAARRFLAIIDEGRARSGRARIGVINREINLAIVPTSDLMQWGVADRWSAPLETFTTQRGDCEDYAIAKYVALRAAGVAAEDVKLVVVRNTDAKENHAVVAVRLERDWVILDNRWLALVPDRAMWRATPLLVIDKDGVRQFVVPTANARLRDGAPASF